MVTRALSHECDEGCKAAELGVEGSSPSLFPSLLRMGGEGSAGLGGLGDAGCSSAGLGGKGSSQALLAPSRRNAQRSSAAVF